MPKILISSKSVWGNFRWWLHLMMNKLSHWWDDHYLKTVVLYFLPNTYLYCRIIKYYRLIWNQTHIYYSISFNHSGRDSHKISIKFPNFINLEPLFQNQKRCLIVKSSIHQVNVSIHFGLSWRSIVWILDMLPPLANVAFVTVFPFHCLSALAMKSVSAC